MKNEAKALEVNYKITLPNLLQTKKSVFLQCNDKSLFEVII